jgi:hypothetical protein
LTLRGWPAPRHRTVSVTPIFRTSPTIAVICTAGLSAMHRRLLDQGRGRSRTARGAGGVSPDAADGLEQHSAKVVGLISLPGAMTGLILAGVDPMTAIRYQIIVMYLLLAAGTIATALATRLADHFVRSRSPTPGRHRPSVQVDVHQQGTHPRQ